MDSRSREIYYDRNTNHFFPPRRWTLKLSYHWPISSGRLTTFLKNKRVTRLSYNILYSVVRKGWKTSLFRPRKKRFSRTLKNAWRILLLSWRPWQMPNACRKRMHWPSLATEISSEITCCLNTTRLGKLSMYAFSISKLAGTKNNKTTEIHTPNFSVKANCHT